MIKIGIVAFVVFLSISNVKQHIVVSGILFLNLAILYSIFFLKPDFVHDYVSDNLKVIDLVFTFIMILFAIGLIYMSLIKKFLVSDFRKLIQKHYHKSLKDQGKIFNLKFLDWKGVDEQIDDVLVLGFKPLS